MWERNNSHSTIGYCLMSSKLYNRLGHIEIDEQGTKSLGSDHKQLKLSLVQQNQKNKFLNEKVYRN